MKADQRIVLLHLLSLETKWQTEAQLILITMTVILRFPLSIESLK